MKDLQKCWTKSNDKHYEELQDNFTNECCFWKNEVYEIKTDWNKFDGKDGITLLNKWHSFKNGQY